MVNRGSHNSETNFDISALQPFQRLEFSEETTPCASTTTICRGWLSNLEVKQAQSGVSHREGVRTQEPFDGEGKADTARIFSRVATTRTILRAGRRRRVPQRVVCGRKRRDRRVIARLLPIP